MSIQSSYVKHRVRSKAISNKNTGLFLLFLIWPFAALIMALRSYHREESRRITWFFLIFYGLTFIIANEGVDSSRYAQHLVNARQLPFSDFWYIISGIYAYEYNVDIFIHVLNFIISRFTDNKHILFGVFAALFGYFFLQSLNLLHDRYITLRNRNALIFILFFVFIIPITSINGFRFYFAAWVYFFGAYNYIFLKRDKKYLLLSLSTLFIHFSFLSAGIVLLVYVFAGNRNKIYLPLAIVSFILPDLFNAFLPQVGQTLGGGLEERISGYSNPDYIQKRGEELQQAKWFVKWNTQLVFFFMVFAVFYIRYKYRQAVKSIEMENLYSFTLLFLSFSNFTGSIASGSRFQSIFLLFSAAYVILFFTRVRFTKLHLVTLIGLFPIVLYVIFRLRIFTNSASVWLITPLPFSFIGPERSLESFLF